MKQLALLLPLVLSLCGCDSSKNKDEDNKTQATASNTLESNDEMTDREAKDRFACILNQRNVQQAIRGHAGINNLPVGTPIDLKEIFGPDAYLHEPKCPSGGTYRYKTSIPPFGVLFCTCSHAGSKGHEPGDFSDW